jgi:hypothetical protein
MTLSTCEVIASRNPKENHDNECGNPQNLNKFHRSQFGRSLVITNLLM